MHSILFKSGRRRWARCLWSLAAAGALPLAAQSSEVAARPVPTALTLRQVLASVGAHHPLLAAAAAEVRAASGARTTAGAFGNPMLAVLVENTAFPGSNAPAGIDKETMVMGTLPLEPLYQRAPRVRAANAFVRVAEAEVRETRRRLASGAIQVFYRTALGQVDVEIAQDIARWLDTLVAANSARVREGVAAEADLLRSQVERVRAIAEAGMREAELARARGELAPFVGRMALSAPGFVLGVAADSGDGGTATLPAKLDEAELQIALERRPDVAATRALVEQSAEAARAERWLIVRELSATVGAKRTAGTTSMVAGFSLPIPLFYQNRGAIKRAAAEAERAKQQLVAVERAAGADIIAAYVAALAWSARGRELTPDLLARADELRRVSLEAYREGAIPLFQALDALRAWGDARHTYYQIIYARQQSSYELMLATGVDLLRASEQRGEGQP